jgi:hypothetical protein
MQPLRLHVVSNAAAPAASPQRGVKRGADTKEEEEEQKEDTNVTRPMKKQKHDDAQAATAAAADTQAAASMDTSEMSTAVDECPICFNVYEEEEDAAAATSVPAAAAASSSAAVAMAESKENDSDHPPSHRRIRRVLNCFHACCADCLTTMVKGEPKSRSVTSGRYIRRDGVSAQSHVSCAVDVIVRCCGVPSTVISSAPLVPSRMHSLIQLVSERMRS